MKIFFGTDGWRGILDSEINLETISTVAQAMADYLRERFDNPTAAIGFDGRKYSKEFAYTFAQILSGNNIKVFLSDKIIPTPFLSLAVKKLGLNSGIMITASHNPPQYNGVKFKDYYGGPFFTEETIKVENLLNQSTIRKNSNKIEYFDFSLLYLDNIKKIIDFDKLKGANLKILIDSMGGAGNNYISKFLSGGNLIIDTIFSPPDSNFYGRNAEPIEMNLLPLKEKLINERYAMGLATDGDADRLGVMLNNGNWLSAQYTILLLAEHIVKQRNISGHLVKTSSVTDKIKILFESENRKVFDVQVGFKYVCEKMMEIDAAFGGEESGGFGYKNHVPERDGILSALFFIELLIDSGYNHLLDLYETKLHSYGDIHYKRIDLKYDLPDRIDLLPKLYSEKRDSLGPYKIKDIHKFYSSREIINGLKFIFEGNTRWLLLRSSETEPLIRIYSEADSDFEVDELLNLAKEIFIGIKKNVK